MIFKLAFYTQYNQFYIVDEKSPKKIGRTSFWTTEAYDDRLAIAEGILGIGTECYGPIKGEVTILDNVDNNFNSSEFDHIVEGGIQIQSGQLEVLDCPTSKVQLELKINPGTYRVRIYSSNLNSVEGDEGNDYYKIEIWPDVNLERKVLKRYISK